MTITHVPKKAKPNSYFVQKVIKNDTYTVLTDSQMDQEDTFAGMYYTTVETSRVFIEPPFDPRFLQKRVSLNNILSQCIDAMEVNIDGTGYTLQPMEQGKDIDKGEQALLDSFFGEPYPGKSFITLRRLLRRDLESIGWSFFEVLRNVNGDMVSIRNVLTNSIRMVKLDAPVMVSKTVSRNGKDVQLQYWDRERRYAQKVGNNLLYFRDYGSTRQLNKLTGEWESKTNVVPTNMRASELLMFTVNPDPDSMYGLPHWINNLPSVLGSRKAEEQNLEFFDAGGVPPAIIFVQGGTLGNGMADQLRMYLSGQMKSKNRAVVVEALSTSGSLDGAAGSVQVKVERFGSEKANDPLYKSYDDAAQEHIRIAFRLPGLFLGRADDYNFATAKTAYMVAEAQVFQPERDEFDEIINNTVLKELGIKSCKFKSNPITLKDVDQQLASIKVVQDVIKKDDLVEQINGISGLNLIFDKEAQDAQKLKEQKDQETKDALSNAQISAFGAAKPAVGKPVVGKPNLKVVPKAIAKSEGVSLVKLALAYGQAKGFLVSKFEMSDSDKEETIQQLQELSAEEREAVLDIVSSLTLNAVDPTLMDVFAEHEH